MTETNPMEDIERLENRMRTNFFEIEKRLSSLEGNISSTAFDEVKERVQEIEDLQMLLQAEMLQLKQQSTGDVSGSALPVDLEKRLGKVEEVVTKGVPVAVEKDLETRLERIEKLGNSSEIRRILDSFDARIKSIQPQRTFDIEPINRRIDALERIAKSGQNTDIILRRIDTIERGVQGGQRPDLGPIIKRIENLENSRTGMGEEDTGMISKRIESLERSGGQKADLEILLKRMENLERTVREKGDDNNIVKRIELSESMIKDSRAYYSKKISELEDAIESSGKILTEGGMKGFLSKIYEAKNEISKKVEQFDSAKERLDKLLKERQDLINKLEQSEVNVSKSDAMLIKARTEVAKMQSIEEKIISMEQKLGSMMKDKVGDMESIRSDLFERVKRLNDKVSADLERSSSLREEMSSKIKDEIEKSSFTRQEIASKVDDIRKSMDRFEKKHSEMDIENRLQMGVSELKINFDRMAAESERSIAGKTREMEKIKADIERAAKSLVEIEGRINIKMEKLSKFEKATEIEERLENLQKSYMSESEKQWNEIRRIDDEIKHVGTLKGGDSEEMHMLIEEMKKLSDASRMQRAELKADEGSIAGFEKTYESEIEKHKADISRLDERLRNIEESGARGEIQGNRAYEQSARAVNDYLRKFSVTVDEKLGRMEKDIYDKVCENVSQEVSRKAYYSRSPNLEPLISQISALENELIEMQDSLRGVTRRVPTIIE